MEIDGHEMIVRSLSDGMLECTCGDWYCVKTGTMPLDEAQDAYKGHLHRRGIVLDMRMATREEHVVSYVQHNAGCVQYAQYDRYTVRHPTKDSDGIALNDTDPRNLVERLCRKYKISFQPVEGGRVNYARKEETVS